MTSAKTASRSGLQRRSLMVRCGRDRVLAALRQASGGLSSRASLRRTYYAYARGSLSELTPSRCFGSAPSTSLTVALTPGEDGPSSRTTGMLPWNDDARSKGLQRPLRAFLLLAVRRVVAIESSMAVQMRLRRGQATVDRGRLRGSADLYTSQIVFLGRATRVNATDLQWTYLRICRQARGIDASAVDGFSDRRITTTACAPQLCYPFKSSAPLALPQPDHRE